MIGRCDWCDEGRRVRTGQRVSGKLVAHVCRYCGGPLRRQRPGERPDETTDAAGFVPAKQETT